MTRYASVALLAATLVPACNWEPRQCEGEWAAVPPDGERSMVKSRMVAEVMPVESTAVDILFVIDDSKSMTDEQAQLGIWSKELFDVLSLSGELPDLHIAVVSSSLSVPERPGCEYATGGSLHVGTAALQGTKYLRDVAGLNGARERNYTGTLTDTFAKMARVGDSGCGFEQPFKAARWALSQYNPDSKGFLRDEALLLVVFVTDEDDCSARSSELFSYDQYTDDACSELGPITSYRCFEHGVKCHDGKGSRSLGERSDCRPDEDSQYVESVSAFADELKRVKPQPGQVIVAGIYGKPNHIEAIRDERVTSYRTPRLANVCGGGGVEGTGATPAVRMNALMAEFGGRASHSSICERELAWAMRDMGLITREVATRSHCLRGQLFDTDGVVAGVQPACRVQIVDEMGTPLERRALVRPCDGANDGTPCFTLDVDAECAETDSQLAFRVHDYESAGKNHTLTVSCDVAVDDTALSNADPRAFD